MKNLNSFVGNAFEVYRLAASRKQTGVVKQMLLAAEPNVALRFNLYDQLFQHNQLETLSTDTACQAIKTELSSLYEFDNAAVREIRDYINDHQVREVRYTCQYCAIGSIETMDHVVSQSEFAEFVIHPRNLIPCCWKCNTHKSDNWRKGGIRQFINLYTDLLPTERYLFVIVIPDLDGKLDFEYRLRNPGTIAGATWRLIESHFQRLHLFQRMKEKSIAELTEIVYSAKSYFSRGLSQDEVRAAMREKAASNRRRYGNNYWRCALDDALEQSGDFWNYVNIFE